MENTKENKVRFFGSYINQKYYRDVTENNDTKTVGQYKMYNKFDNVFTSMDTWAKSIYPNVAKVNDYLLLKPLSSITDEDAIEVAFILTDEVGWVIEHVAIDEVVLESRLWNCKLHLWFDGEFLFSQDSFSQCPLERLQVYDYLRSKGYALPFMGLSVEEQVSYGWIKLIEE